MAAVSAATCLPDVGGGLKLGACSPLLRPNTLSLKILAES